MLGAGALGAERLRRLPRSDDDVAGPVGEPLKGRLRGRREDVRCQRRGEPLVYCLLGHAERGADLGPGPAVATAPVDEVPEQGIGGLFQLCGRGGGGDELVERLVGARVVADGVDQLLKRGRWRHGSTLS